MNRYFTKMKIIKDEKVINVCASFRSLRITNWIDSSKDTITAKEYTFNMFMMELHEQFLKSNWAKKLYRSEIKWGMLPNQCFMDYVNCIIYYNIILKGTANHSDDAKLHDTLSHNMSEGLVNKLDTLATDEHMRINDIVSLNMWVREVETVDHISVDHISVDHIWKADVKNTANLMNEVMNKRNQEDTQNTARQPDHHSNNELPSQNENHDENHYHPYHSHSDHG